MIDPESPGARFTSKSMIYKIILCYNLSMKFSKFQGAKVHCLGSIVSNISILTFNRNENNALIVTPVLNVSFVSAESTVIHLSDRKTQTNCRIELYTYMITACMTTIKGVAVPISIFFMIFISPNPIEH